MHEVLNWVWQGCVIALATGITLQFLTRARARDRYAFCWAVLIFVLLLPVLPRVAIAPAAPSTAVDASPVPLVTMPHTWWTSTRIAITLWMLWVTTQTIRLATGFIALRRIRSGCTSFPASVESQLTYWTRVKAQGRRTDLVVADGVRSAAVLGCGSPVIAVAPAVIDRLHVDELDRIIVHEWAHVQRRDDGINVIQVVIRVVAGWHPALWWLNRQLQIEREVACDEMAVALTGSSKGYASSLATLAGLVPRRSHAIATLGALSSPALTRRILRILSQNRLASPLSSARTAITAAVFICALSMAIAEYDIVGSPVLTPLVAVVEAGSPLSRASSARPSSAASTPAASMTHARSAEPRMQTWMAQEQSTTRSEADVASIEAGTAQPQPRTSSSADSARFAALEPLHRSNPEFRLLDIRLTAPARVVPVGPPKETNPNTITPWGAAANAGVGLGRRSQDAGSATAGAFSRLGKKIASSF